MTPAFSINSIQNAMLSVRFPGSFAHTNIVPLPFGFSQPMEASPSHRASCLVLSALFFYAVKRSLKSSDSSFLDWQEHTEIDLAAKLF